MKGVPWQRGAAERGVQSALSRRARRQGLSVPSAEPAERAALSPRRAAHRR